MSAIPTMTLWVLAAWLGLAGAGAWQLAEHATTAGTIGDVPQRLSAELAGALHWQGRRPLLVLAAHPQCPCLPSTLDGLARVLERHPEVELRMLVYTPGTNPPSWDDSRWQTLRDGLPDGTVLRDPDGRLATALGATTSGHLSLYAPIGTLTFHGGITQGRGHTGENPAERALLQALELASPRGAGASHPATRNAPQDAIATAVFGCPLTTSADACHD